ncbi:hypothetical protein IRB23M11_08790 [Alkalibacterium sp. m-11]|uniref:ABC transporter domain-containing protein n=1 Tax=Alkalibacterium indicireducens TaxID=398758 RepID=A0ABP3L9V5_9LACT
MIEVKDIHKQFGRKKVLNGVSFTIEKGEISCLVGVNGVGKTTILNAIMNLTPVKKVRSFSDVIFNNRASFVGH